MKRLSRLFTALAATAALVTTLLPSAPATAASQPEPPQEYYSEYWANDRILVEVQPGIEPREAAESHGLELGKHLFNNWYVFNTEPGMTVEAYKSMLEDVDVAMNTEFDYRNVRPREFTKAELDILYCHQNVKCLLDDWKYRYHNIGPAHEIFTGSADSILAMVGSGVDLNHPMFEGRMMEGYDFADGDSEPQDVDGIGTSEAGIAAGSVLEGTDVSGIDLEAQVLPVRVFNDEGEGYISTLLEGMNYAKEKGAKVIHASGYHEFRSKAVQDFIKDVMIDGQHIVIMNSNICLNPLGCPPEIDVPISINPDEGCPPCANRYEDIMYPGGVITDLKPSDLTPYGDWVQTAIIDSGIITAGLDGQLAQVSGSSMSSAALAGAASLIWSAHPDLSGKEVLERIALSSQEIEGTGEYFSNGLMDLEKALNY